ncbi:MAG: ABC transporter permease [Muribaculaceae bacterium]|nr:ABC transporter permease [Muribaculaceae bacterium]
MKPTYYIASWFAGLFRVWRREFHLIFSDIGVMLFFFALPTGYPVIYSLIYNPEVVTDLPVAVVDNSRTAQSRELARMIDATSAMKIYDYVPDLNAARRLMNEHKVYGILEIPEDYARRLGSGEQATTVFYAEMDLLLRYRTFVSALTDVQLALGAEIQTHTVNDIGLLAQGMDQAPVETESVMIGDPTQGFASFIMPGIVVLILQQSIVLGICILAGTARERRLRNGGYDPMAVNAPPTAQMFGKMLCYLTLYIPLTYYILDLVPAMFSFPHIGEMWAWVSFMVPFLVCSIFFGQCISRFVTDRESAFLVVVFTSVVFLFLSGLTWPRYGMNKFWTLIGDFIPATWGMEGFLGINSNGSSIGVQMRPYTALWMLSGVYFLVSYLLLRMRGKTAVTAGS